MQNTTFLSSFNDDLIRLDCEMWTEYANIILAWPHIEDSYWYEEMISSHLLYDC